MLVRGTEWMPQQQQWQEMAGLVRGRTRMWLTDRTPESTEAPQDQDMTSEMGGPGTNSRHTQLRTGLLTLQDLAVANTKEFRQSSHPHTKN